MTLYCTVQSPHEWLITDRSGKISEYGTVDELTEVPSHLPVVLVVPGEQLIIHHLTVPARSRGRLLQAIPNALEEQLATDLENLHFALLHWQRGEQASVAVVAKSRMDEWLDICHQANLQPQQMIPDILCVPRHPQSTMTVAGTTSGRVLIRDGEYSGLAVQIDDLPLLLKEYTETLPLIAVNDEVLATKLMQLGVQETSLWAFGNSLRAWLTEARPPACNLLQGPYVQQQPYARKGRTWMKVAAGAVVVSSLLILFANGYEYYQLMNLQQQLRMETRALLTSNFPEIKRVVNPRVQLQRQLDALKSGYSQNNFMLFLDVIGQLQSQQKFRIEVLDFRNNQLTVTLRVKDFTTLDKLQRLLKKDHRVLVELLSSNLSQKQVNARIRFTQEKT